METTISIFVLSITIAACMGVAANYLKNKTNFKKNQQYLEELSMAVNAMSKQLRMTNCSDPGVHDCKFASDDIVTINNASASNNRLEYYFAATMTGAQKLIFNSNCDATSSCASLPNRTNGIALMNPVCGQFYFNNLEANVNAGTAIQLITIRMWKPSADGTCGAQPTDVFLQTSVSMRGGYAAP